MTRILRARRNADGFAVSRSGIDVDAASETDLQISPNSPFVTILESETLTFPTSGSYRSVSQAFLGSYTKPPRVIYSLRGTVRNITGFSGEVGVCPIVGTVWNGGVKEYRPVVKCLVYANQIAFGWSNAGVMVPATVTYYVLGNLR